MAVKGKTYNNWKELFDAFNSGELDKSKYTVVMDNDGCRLRYIGDDMDEDEAYEHAIDMFDGNGYSDIVDVLQAAGIPAEWC